MNLSHLVLFNFFTGASPAAAGTTTITLDGTSSAADAGQSLTYMQWVFTLTGPETLIIGGLPTDPPTFVYDSRGTLDLTDVGGIITGDVELCAIDLAGASLSAPWDIDIAVTQTDTQFDSDDATEV